MDAQRRPPRKMVTFRISQSADAWISGLAGRLGAERSVVIRAMLAVATQHQNDVALKVKHEMESR